MIDVQGSQLIPPLMRFRQTAGASGSPSPNMEVQFEIITASASGGVSVPWVGEEMGEEQTGRLSSLGGRGLAGGSGTPQTSALGVLPSSCWSFVSSSSRGQRLGESPLAESTRYQALGYQALGQALTYTT